MPATVSLARTARTGDRTAPPLVLELALPLHLAVEPSLRLASVDDFKGDAAAATLC